MGEEKSHKRIIMRLRLASTASPEEIYITGS